MDHTPSITKATQPYLFQNGFILTNLPEADLRKLEKSTIIEFGKRGHILFRQNGFPSGVYWLIDGMVKIYQETATGHHTIYIYSSKDLIGFRQLIAEEQHPVSAAFLEDSTYRFIPGEIFRELLNTSPFFVRNVLSALAREFSIWSNRMTYFSHFPVRKRLVLALLILHEQYRIYGSPGGVITITRTEISEYIGASLETVVRMLNNLKTQYLVSLAGRKIILKDIDGLLKILEPKAEK